MVISGAYYQHCAARLDVNKYFDSTAIDDLHPCHYNGDLGSDDSDPESQASDSSTTSQDSGHSPATSYSSEESRADQDQEQCANEAQYNSSANWSSAQLSIENQTATRVTTREVPFRPKSESNLYHKPTEVVTATLQQTPNDYSNASCSNYQNPRRGRSAASITVPALRRDTDPTDNIVRMIVFFCTNLINSIWCTSGQSPVETTSRQGGNVLPLEVFITETLRRSKTSYSTLQIALYYLILLKQCLPAQATSDQSGCRAMQCGRRMFLTSLILASKYLQDRNYSARAWSKISGLPLKEINENERRYLSIVNWDLHVPKCTFENWSKIVLQVCRKSQELSSSYKGAENFAAGPRSGPTGAQQCFTSPTNGSNRAWWFVNLRMLRTDVVKCPFKTQTYVESLCPFKQTTPIVRPVSPASDASDDSLDSLADILVETPTGSRQASMDRSSKRFEPVPDLLHPAAPLAMPPQPTLKNLPTPLTTPQSNVQNYWTPRLGHQNSSSSLRCKASAYVLGTAFRKHCPIANLETCPPPPPQPQYSQSICDRTQRSYTSVENVPSTSASVVSSPESVVSDVFSVPSRSRSSSISSTASWATNSSHNFDLRWFVGNQSAVVPLACPRQHSDSGSAPRAEQVIERPRTAFKVAEVVDTGRPFPYSGKDEPTPACNPQSYIRHEKTTRAQREAILAGLQVDESVVRSRARPALSRSGTQIYNPREEQDVKVQQLKRSRSDTFEYSANPSCPLPTTQTSNPSQGTTPECWNTLKAFDHVASLVNPTQCWAQPRKPLQTGPQNKRLALQIPTPSNFAAAELASRTLRPDICSRIE